MTGEIIKQEGTKGREGEEGAKEEEGREGGKRTEFGQLF